MDNIFISIICAMSKEVVIEVELQPAANKAGVSPALFGFIENCVVCN